MSVKLHGIVGTTHALDRAWPETLDATDPYAGDEVIEYPGRFANYARYSVEERIDEAEHDRWDSVFCESFRGVLRGDEDPVRLAEAARKLQVDLPLTHDRRPPRVAPRVLGEERLSDIVENWVPDIGILGPDRVLGPWADESLPAWLHRLCGRVLCFSPILPPAVRPMGREQEPPAASSRGPSSLDRHAPSATDAVANGGSRASSSHLGSMASRGAGVGIARDPELCGSHLQDPGWLAVLLCAPAPAPSRSRPPTGPHPPGAHALASL